MSLDADIHAPSNPRSYPHGLQASHLSHPSDVPEHASDELAPRVREPSPEGGVQPPSPVLAPEAEASPQGEAGESPESRDPGDHCGGG